MVLTGVEVEHGGVVLAYQFVFGLSAAFGLAFQSKWVGDVVDVAARWGFIAILGVFLGIAVYEIRDDEDNRDGQDVKLFHEQWLHVHLFCV